MRDDMKAAASLVKARGHYEADFDIMRAVARGGDERLCVDSPCDTGLPADAM